jgi:hypothetical protein
MSIRRKLHAAGQSIFQILDKMMSSTRMSSSDEPAGHKLGIWVERNPSPNVASSVHLLFDMAIFLLRINERPNLVTLDSLTWKIAKNLVLILGTRASESDQQFHNRCAMDARHATNGAKRIAFNQSSHDRLSFIGSQLIHD